MSLSFQRRGMHLPALASLALAVASIGGCSSCSTERLQPADRQVAASTHALDFGKVYIGHPARLEVTLEETGKARLAISGVRVDGSGAFTASATGLVVAVNFDPQSAGPAAGQLSIENDSENEPIVLVSLAGEALPVPLCDDHNPCTDDAFDLATAQCTHAKRDGACDDRSACTEHDTCVDGVCRGVVVDCDDKNPCTRDACDATSGCIHLPDPTVCDDHDPCTTDLCDRTAGCSHPDAPDGTPCGTGASCAEMKLCVRGACLPFAAPDGFPCSDGDMCTVGDSCRQGVCTGTRMPATPAIRAELRTFGSAGAHAVVLPGGTLVFADPPISWLGTSTAMDWSFSVVHRNGGALELVKVSPVSAPFGVASLAPVDSNHLLALSRSAGFGPYFVQMLEVRPDSSVVPLATLPEQIQDQPWVTENLVQVLNDALYLCPAFGGRGELVTYDISDRAKPVESSRLSLATLAPSGGGFFCNLLGADAASHKMIVSGTTGLAVVDLTDPLHPKSPQRLPISTPVAFFQFSSNQLAVTDGAGSEINFYDGTTFVRTGTLTTGKVLGPGFALSGGHLYGVEQTGNPYPLHLVDYVVSDPAHPAVLAEQVLDAEGIPVVAQVAQGLAVVEAMGWQFPPRLFKTDGAGTDLPLVTGPAQGGALNVMLHDGLAFAADRHSVHRFQLPRTGAPALLSGGISAGHGFVIRIGPSTPADLLVGGALDFAEPGAHSFFSGDDPLAPSPASFAWLDASQSDAPRAGAYGAFPDARERLLKAEGEALMAVMAGPSQVTLERYRLGQTFPSATLTLVPSATAIAPAPIPRQAVVEETLGVERGGTSVALAVTYTADPSSHLPASDLLVYDSTGTSLSLRATMYFTHAESSVRSLGIAGSLVAAVLVPSQPVTDTTASRLVIFEVDPVHGQLTQRHTLDLAGASHLLQFDGRTALLSTATGIAFVDVSGIAPTVLGSLTTPQFATTADLLDDQLVIGATSSMLVVSPPCPPLP